MKENRLTLTLCSQLGSEKVSAAILLRRSTLIMTRSPFSNAVTFEKHNPTLVSYHRWKEDTGK